MLKTFLTRAFVREDTEQVPNSPIKASRTPVPPVQTMVSTNTDVAIVEQNAYVPSNEVITVRDITFEMSGADDKQKNSCDVQNLVEFDNIDDIINAFPEDNNIDLEQFGDVATTVYPMDWFNMPDEVQCAMDSGDTFPNDVDKALSTEQIQSDEIEDVVLDNSMLDEIKDVLNENVFDIMDITTSDIDSIPENKTTPTSRKRKQMDTSNGISVVIEETSNTGKEQEKVVTVISTRFLHNRSLVVEGLGTARSTLSVHGVAENADIEISCVVLEEPTNTNVYTKKTSTLLIQCML